MRTYIAITGTVFGLIVVAHIARGVQEGISIFDPWYIALTLTCAALAVWAVMLLLNASGHAAAHDRADHL